MVKHIECKGPCDQGRKPCPTPWACEVEEPDTDPTKVVIGDTLIAAVLLGVVVLLAWTVML